MKKILALILAAMLALCFMVAWAEDTTQTSKDTLIVGSTTEMSGNFFSDMFGSNASDIDVRALLHGYNLMEWIGENGSYGVNSSVVSGLIVTDDAEGNRTYTIALYNDLYYSDGTPITAADYAFSMLLSIAPEMRAIGANTVGSDYIVGIDAYKTRQTKALTGMRILSPYQMSITVKASYRPFFYELALLNYDPYPIHVIAPGCEVVDNGEGVLIRNKDLSATEPIFTAELLQETLLDPTAGYVSHPTVVSGPYVLAGYDSAAHVAQFAVNSWYKGNSHGVKATIPHVIFKAVKPDTMMSELAAGEVDLIHKAVSEKNISEGLDLTADGGIVSESFARNGQSFISFNCEKPTVSSQAVRQAIAMALDKPALVNAHVGNYGQAVDGYYGIGQWMYRAVSGMVAVEDDNGEAWADVNLNGITKYAFDLDAAAALLEQDGWTLNQNGIRSKEIDGSVTTLELKLIYPEGNAIADAMESAFAENLVKIGVTVTLEAMPMSDLLDAYYRNTERDCDMIYLASDFATVFDPSYTFSPDDAYQGQSNRTAIVDAELYARAVALRQTEPGDTLAYCQKWVAFQERWTEVLPAIPVYSSTYYDFYTSSLQNFTVSDTVTWSQAIIGSYFGEPAE